ncbi:MAG: hypothetical protein MUO53_07220 [Maribacter sp.]|nr:hypothetical protein [Maribacter sp.]
MALQKKALSPVISEFLFMENDATKNEKTDYVHHKIEIRELLKDGFNRKVFVEILLDLGKDISGDSQKRLFKLYTDLGLQNDAYANLKSWRWEVVSKGILELTQMNVEESYNFIIKFINDKRSTIRKQAEIATVTLKHEGINYFLDTTTYKISEWQQLKLLDVLRNFEDYQPPAFKAWLTSNNTHTVLFALRLIKYYSQNDAYASIIELVKHKSNQIKLEAINCIKEFNIVEAVKILKIIFWKSSIPLKISILDAIASIGNENDILFLRSIESKERSFSVKSKAISAINAIAPESILPTKGIEDISQYTIPKDIPPAKVTPPHLFSNIEETLIIEHSPTNENVEFVPDWKKLHEIQVVVEVVLPEVANKPKEKEKSDREVNKLEQIEVTDIDLGFLPIVVDNSRPELKDVHDDLDAANERHILDLPVVFQQVQPVTEAPHASLNINDEGEKGPFDDPELNFLPLVVEKASLITTEAVNEVQDDQPYRFKIVSRGKTSTNSHKDIEVVFEAINSIPSKNHGPTNVDKITEGNMVLREENSLAMIPPSIKDIDIKNIRGIDICYEILSAERAYDDEAFITGPKDDVGLDREENAMASKVEEHEVARDSGNEHFEDSFRLLAKPQFYDAETLAMIQLLDDIEELGDEREIPLLLSILEQETNSEIKERIRHLVKKFAHWEPYPQKNQDVGSKKELSPSSSLIKELFENNDRESQIILLDTLIEVMDEKELDFLEGLSHHPDDQIRQKSRIALSALNKRLALESPRKDTNISHKVDGSFENELFDFESKPSGKTSTIKEHPQEAPDIFNVEFELTPLFENIADCERETLSSATSLLGHLRSMSNMLIKKLNG